MEDTEFFLHQPLNVWRPENFVGPLDGLKSYCESIQIHQPLGEDYPARLAPSLVARGEQILNLDIPRFVVRVYIDRDSLSFVNLRRLSEIKARLAHESWLKHTQPFKVYRGDAEDEHYTPVDGFTPQHKWFVKSNTFGNAIADCVFVPPIPSLENNLEDASGYDLVTAQLGWPYGERCDIRGISYVRALFGFGGACAQACAFMVSAMLQDHLYRGSDSLFLQEPSAVHGLAEVTAITTPETYEFLQLGGLRPEVLCSYFAAVGHSAFQFVVGHTDLALIADCVAAYVRSGIAPILLVMEPVCTPEGEVEWPPCANHAVVAVGATRDLGHRKLIINDPTYLQFSVVDGTYLRDHMGNAKNEPSFICAVPGSVTVPLITATVFRHIKDANNSRPLGVFPRATAVGILDMALDLKRRTNAPISFGGLRDPTVNDFTLHHLLLKDESNDTVPTMPPHLEELLKRDTSFQDTWKRKAFPILSHAGRWVWIQLAYTPANELSMIIVWNAEDEPVRLSDLANSLDNADPARDPFYTRCLAIVRKNGNTWSCELTSDRERQPRHPLYVREYGPAPVSGSYKGSSYHEWLEPSLITSFSATNLTLAALHWPKDIIHVAELYAFMHCDAGLIQGYPTDWLPSIVEYLSTISKKTSEQQRNEINRIVNHVYTAFEDLSSVRFAAMSTHLPQLFSANKESALQAKKAMLMLIQIRRMLHERMGSKGDIRVIVLAAGSLISGILPARPRGASNDSKVTLFAKREDRMTVALPRIIDKLVELCSEIPASDDFSLALELETGPLFSINDLSSLEKIVSILKTKKPEIQHRIGFTVDISQWVLSGIPLSAVKEKPELLKRICHFHISDQPLGYFGHTPIGDCSLGEWCTDNTQRLELFREWINWAVEYAHHRQTDPRAYPDSPRFSGIISVELEAARSPAAVHHSCEVLRELLYEAHLRLHSTTQVSTFPSAIERARMALLKRSFARVFVWMLKAFRRPRRATSRDPETSPSSTPTTGRNGDRPNQ